MPPIRHVLVLIGFTPAIFAAQGERAAYSLWNPTPRDQLRELSTDRPDTTESPYTVDAGHVQIEAEPISWSRDREEGVTVTAFEPSVNLKVGLCPSADLQLVLGYRSVRTRDDTMDDRARGIDDTTVRLKVNLWGNNVGDTAGALMPFVTFPTHGRALGSQREVTGGIIAPLAFTLPLNWSAALMVEIDIERNTSDDGYTAVVLQSVTCSHAIADALGGFAELVSVSPREGGREAEAYGNAGVTWGVTPDLQLDAGLNAGLTRASTDLRLFTGVSYRY